MADFLALSLRDCWDGNFSVASGIAFSVGVGGRNVPQDVTYVQHLINSIPVIEGGTEPRLAVDGTVGPLTEQEIAER